MVTRRSALRLSLRRRIAAAACRQSCEVVRDADAALPDAAAIAQARIGAEALQPVGLWDGRYCRAAWLPREATAPAGYAFKGLRSLFGRLDEPLLSMEAVKRLPM